MSCFHPSSPSHPNSPNSVSKPGPATRQHHFSNGLLSHLISGFPEFQWQFCCPHPPLIQPFGLHHPSQHPSPAPISCNLVPTRRAEHSQAIHGLVFQTPSSGRDVEWLRFSLQIHLLSLCHPALLFSILWLPLPITSLHSPAPVLNNSACMLFHIANKNVK